MADSDLSFRLKQAGDVIKRRAAEISSTWSARVPASLETIVEDEAVVVRANPEIAPQARAFEMGLRHPLNYPNQRSWGRTPHRPFLEPAVDEQADNAVQKVSMVVEDWTRKLGFK